MSNSIPTDPCRAPIAPPQAGLFIAADDPLLMIEDAPGRFREEWVQHALQGDVEFVRTANMVTVRVGDVSGAVMSIDGHVVGRIWHGAGTIAVGRDND